MKITTDKAIKSRNNIVKGAIKLFNKKGVDKVSLNEIIRTMNISKGGFYYHFNSKNELMFEIMFPNGLKIEEYYDEIKDKYGSSELLTKAIIYIAKTMSKLDPKQFIVLVSDALEDHYSKDVYNDKIVSPIYNVYNQIISDGVSIGNFRNDIPKDELVESMFSMSLGAIYSWGYSDGKNDIVKNAKAITKIILSGLKN